MSQLARVGIRPADITPVIISHVHFDRCGSHAFFPQTTFLVQRREMARACGPDKPYDLRDFGHSPTYHVIDGDHDIFGDGTLILIPTYGHDSGQWQHIPHAPEPLR